MDRRQTLRFLASVPAGMLSACKSGNTAPAQHAVARQPTWSPRLFSIERALVVEDAVERLIPETDTPGAKSAGVAELIENLLLDTYEKEARERFLTGVDALDADARQVHGRGFSDCSAAHQTALLERLVAALPPYNPEGPRGPEPFFLTLRELTLVSFCNSRLGLTRVIGYEPAPGHYDGCGTSEARG